MTFSNYVTLQSGLVGDAYFDQSLELRKHRDEVGQGHGRVSTVTSWLSVADIRSYNTHFHSHLEVMMRVVYQIPLTCGHMYIDQTGRCTNDVARRDRKSVV